MTARPEVRAQRRFDELVSKGENPVFEEVMKNLQERDYIDSHRETSPLRRAEDAFELNNSEMGLTEEIAWAEGLIRGKFGLLNERVEEARKTYGEYDKRTMELKNQLLDASTALTKLNNEYEKNQQALLDAEHSTKEYDDAVKALEAQLAANQAELKNMGGGLDALKKEYGDLDKGTGELAKSTSTLGKIFGTAGKDADTLAAKEENLRKQNDNLTRQNDKLSDSVKKQRDLVDNLARAQEIAAARYGEGSVKAEEYRKKLADATGQLDKMERELQENQKAIEDNNQAIADGGEAPNAMLDGLKKIEEMTGIKIPAGIETMIGGFGGGALAVGGIVTALAEVGKKRRNPRSWISRRSSIRSLSILRRRPARPSRR